MVQWCDMAFDWHQVASIINFYFESYGPIFGNSPFICTSNLYFTSRPEEVEVNDRQLEIPGKTSLRFVA